MRRKVSVDDLFAPTERLREDEMGAPERTVVPGDTIESEEGTPHVLDQAEGSPPPGPRRRERSQKPSKPQKRQDDLTAKPQASVPPLSEKLTVYIPIEARAQLDIVKARLRSECGVRATYSDIVAAALSSSFQDIDRLREWIERQPSSAS